MVEGELEGCDARLSRGRDVVIFALKVTLAGVEPGIWRRVLVPGGLRLRELHEVIQVAMGWENAHLHSFTIGDLRSTGSDAHRTKNDASTSLEAVAGRGSRFVYTYDFGDSWEHEILVEEVMADEGSPLPRCTGGARACPPEDCGGALGYGELLEILKDPTNPEHGERLEWLGGAFDPEAFELERVNRRLAKLGDGLREKVRLRALKDAGRKRSLPARGKRTKR